MKKKEKILDKTAFPEAVQSFREFLCRHDPVEFSRHLRTAFFDYLFLSHKHGFCEDFAEYIIEVHDLLEVMDVAIVEDMGKEFSDY